MANFSVTAHSTATDAFGTTDANGFVFLLVDRQAPFTVEAHGTLGTSTWLTPQPVSFVSPNIASGASECGGPDCPLVGQVPVDLIPHV